MLGGSASEQSGVACVDGKQTCGPFPGSHIPLDCDTNVIFSSFQSPAETAALRDHCLTQMETQVWHSPSQAESHSRLCLTLSPSCCPGHSPGRWGAASAHAEKSNLPE